MTDPGMDELMILETVKVRLQEIFPTTAAQNVLDSTESNSQEKQGTTRENGILERNYAERGYHLDIQLSPDQLLTAASTLFELGFFLETITGVDWIKEDQIEAVYDFSRYDFDLCRVVVRVRTVRSKPILPTITGIYTGANWHEREAHDFFGIEFTDRKSVV